MGHLKRFPLTRLVSEHQITHLIETGYGIGNSCRYALGAGFKAALSCEIYPPLYEKARQHKEPGITVSPEDSLTFLRSASVVRTLKEQRCLIFLDAHYPGSDYGDETYNSDKWDTEQQLPLIAELHALKETVGHAIVIIDDCRIYRKDFEVAMGSMPDDATHQFAREEEFISLLESFGETHSLHWFHEETGYAMLWPHSLNAPAITPWILPGDVTAKFYINQGVVGTTCMSINRRLQDARFSTRWLQGHGLDIGGGPDSIGIYKSLFPLIQQVTVYDLPQGDAQFLANVPDNSFDFVYSAHCLEHMVDPAVALHNWLRVLKPGGHLVLTVPDEDLYEQRVWPSTFNSDHKHTFTLFKRHSWSPVSINMLELLTGMNSNIAVQKIELLNQSYLPGLPRFDQTRTPYSESGIEVIIRKID